MNRKEELMKIIEKTGEDNKKVLKNLVDEVIYLEDQMLELKKLPFLRIDKKNPMRQQATPASKQYKELLQQYTNIIKILMSTCGEKMDTETSPLREWANQMAEMITR